MNSDIRTLEPEKIWNHFADLNAVPRPSKKEEKVIQFIINFGKSLGLETERDEIGNVVIKKPATKGMESKKTVILQSHLDMVHQKNEGTDFNFETDGINMYVDGDWVKAKGTTLGADNGLGVASIMAILSSKDIQHPEIEALFTIDEETGMTGAMELRKNWLKGEILLNLDTEEDDEIGVGCAGGIDITASKKYINEAAPLNAKAYQLALTGLSGGHSGMDINKGLANANQLMNTLLLELTKRFDAKIANLKGGSLRNAIPRESFATVVIDFTSGSAFEDYIEERNEVLKGEYKDTDPELKLSASIVDEPEEVIVSPDQDAILSALDKAHNGVYKMSDSIPDLVETSNNIAKVTVQGGEARIECLTRSSIEQGKKEMVDQLTSVFEKHGFNVSTSGNYPGWAPNMDSPILKVLDSLYQELNGSKAHIAACHAGLECGILGQRYPNLDVISFGPNILGAHSPDERASVSSTQKFWAFLKEILKNIPEKES